ncbi:hypothetical protein ACF1FX_11395 [Streptomyces sp. NPDC014646]|uniref:hypothetical protein n=1 Tax=unclassified Streptomyces TaxID=2593676 RepID=UPI0036FA08B9
MDQLIDELVSWAHPGAGCVALSRRASSLLISTRVVVIWWRAQMVLFSTAKPAALWIAPQGRWAAGRLAGFEPAAFRSMALFGSVTDGHCGIAEVSMAHYRAR